MRGTRRSSSAMGRVPSSGRARSAACRRTGSFRRPRSRTLPTRRPPSRFREKTRETALVFPVAVSTHVGVDEPIVVRGVDADTAVPAEGADLALDDAGIERFHFPGGDDPKVTRVPERVLAVRGDVVPLLAQHLVELRAPIAAHELDARAGMVSS